VFLNPRFPERCLVGDGSGRLIADYRQKDPRRAA
jgi:hypothetical protein